MTNLLDAMDIYNICMKYKNKEDEQEEYVKELKATYKREKEALEAKYNSLTNFNTIHTKNGKVENKIFSIDSQTQSKINYIDSQLRDTEERRGRDISAVNSRCDKYRDYLLSQKQLLENKKEIVIKDLSSNFVKPTLGDSIDEDAFPKLTKMKLTIAEEEKKLKDYVKLKEKYYNDYMMALEKQHKRMEQEQKDKQREDDAVERQKERLAQEKFRADRAIKAIQDDRVRQEKEQQRKDDEEKEKKTVEWRKTVLKPLLRDDEFSNCYQQLSDSMKKQFESDLSPSEEIMIYVNEIKDDLLLLHKYSDALMDDDNNKQLYYKYDVLSYDEKLEVVKTKTKKKQRELICKYHEEYVEREKEE